MKNLYDLIIIGAGAAGLTAALYAGRAKMKTLVIEKSDPGGQIKITNEVVNYPGVVSTTGADLAAQMKKQATNFGAVFAAGDATAVDFSGDIKKVTTTDGTEYLAVAVIIAGGAKPRKLGFEGEEEFAGRGIAYCATCDGEFFAGKDVFVIGAGFAAAEEAIFLTRFAKKVTVIAREPEFTCSQTIADSVLAHPKIEVKFNTEIVYARGNSVVQEAKFVNNQTGETFVHKVETGVFGIFVFVGYEPESGVYGGQVETDKWGYIPANEDMETNIPGVYVAGDIRPKRLRQLVTATSDGAIAATASEKYISETKQKLGIVIEPAPAQEAQHEPLLGEQASAQIKYVMDRTESQITIAAILEPENELSDKIKDFLREYVGITDKMSVTVYKKGENPSLEAKLDTLPAIALLDKNGEYTGVSFSGVPGGHELESFVLAIYNAAGPGQAMDDSLRQRILQLPATDIKVGVSLSCTMCPELVQSCQRIALLNPKISAAMIDLQYFPEIRDKHNIMSVPAMLINDSDLLFGKKSLEEMVTLLEER